MSRRILITSKATGLGSDLMSVVGAWRHARATGRALGIDWTRSRYLKDPGRNLFFDLFDVPQEIGGVEMLSSDEVVEASARADDRLSELPKADYLELLFRGTDIPPDIVNCGNTFHVMPPPALQRAVLEQIRMKPDIADAVAAIQARDFIAGQTIAIHVRHGNGERISSGREAVVADGNAHLAGVIGRMVAVLGTDRYRRILVCTDGPELERDLLDSLPGSFTTPKPSVEPGAGPLHRPQFDFEGARTALISRANLLVYNNSWFSHPARILGDFNLPPINLTPTNLYGVNEDFLAKIIRNRGL